MCGIRRRNGIRSRFALVGCAAVGALGGTPVGALGGTPDLGKGYREGVTQGARPVEASEDVSDCDNVAELELWSLKQPWHCYNYHYRNHLSNCSHHQNALGVECDLHDALVATFFPSPVHCGAMKHASARQCELTHCWQVAPQQCLSRAQRMLLLNTPVHSEWMTLQQASEACS